MKKTLLNLAILVFLSLNFGCTSENSSTPVKEETLKTNEPKQETISVQDVPKEKAIWTRAKVVDEFGDEVQGESSIIGIFKGKMSNGATSNADVTIKVQVNEKKESFISFFEYGNTPGSLPEKKLFNIKIKKEDGSTEFIEQFSMNNMLIDTKGNLMTKILAQSTPLKINVALNRISQHNKTTYNFSIDPKGLSELLNE